MHHKPRLHRTGGPLTNGLTLTDGSLRCVPGDPDAHGGAAWRHTIGGQRA